MKYFFRLLLCVACAYVMAGCEKKEDEEYGEWESVTVRPYLLNVDIMLNTSHPLYVGKFYKSTTNEWFDEFEPYDIKEHNITFKSNDENIATVDDKGNVYGVSLGTTEIKIKIDNKNECSCTINVLPNIQFKTSEFKEYLVENFDTNSDGEISLEEAENITEIYIPDLGCLYSLSGIEYMPNLTSLWIEGGGKYLDDKYVGVNLDLSNNKKLTRFYAEGIYVKEISYLGENLKSFHLRTHEEKLTLDLATAPNLDTLFIQGSVKKINFAGCTNLKSLEITTSTCVLGEDFYNLAKLKILAMSGTFNIQTLNLSFCPELEYLYIYNWEGSISESIDLSKNSNINYLCIIDRQPLQKIIINQEIFNKNKNNLFLSEQTEIEFAK